MENNNSKRQWQMCEKCLLIISAAEQTQCIACGTDANLIDVVASEDLQKTYRCDISDHPIQYVQPTHNGGHMCVYYVPLQQGAQQPMIQKMCGNRARGTVPWKHEEQNDYDYDDNVE